MHIRIYIFFSVWRMKWRHEEEMSHRKLAWTAKWCCTAGVGMALSDIASGAALRICGQVSCLQAQVLKRGAMRQGPVLPPCCSSQGQREPVLGIHWAAVNFHRRTALLKTPATTDYCRSQRSGSMHVFLHDGSTTTTDLHEISRFS